MIRGVLLAAALAGTACGHPIEGALDPGPLPPAAQVADAPDLAFAAADGERPGFLQVEAFAHEGALYLRAATILDGQVPWVDRLVRESSLRVLANGKVYPARAVHLATPPEIEPLLPTLVAKLLHIEATGLRYVPDSERYPGTQLRQWYFRVEPDPGRLSSHAGATGDAA